jgi:hypothetical protein
MNSTTEKYTEDISKFDNINSDELNKLTSKFDDINFDELNKLTSIARDEKKKIFEEKNNAAIEECALQIFNKLNPKDLIEEAKKGRTQITIYESEWTENPDDAHKCQGIKVYDLISKSGEKLLKELNSLFNKDKEEKEHRYRCSFFKKNSLWIIILSWAIPKEESDFRGKVMMGRGGRGGRGGREGRGRGGRDIYINHKKI